MKSLWNEFEISSRNCLERDAKTDILIIGGGIAGILLAYELEQRGACYMLVEGKNIGGGVTGNTTGKITSQHGLIYDRLIKSKGADTARKYFDANEKAVEKYNKICAQKKIECNFERCDSFVYSSDNAKLVSEFAALKAVGACAEYCNELPALIKAAGGVAAVSVKNQAQFHVRKFLGAVSHGLNIYENTFVRKIMKNYIITDCGKIQYKRLVVATHFPIINHLGLYFAKMHQYRTYLWAAEDCAEVSDMYIDEAEGGMTFRHQGNLLVYGGGGHKTGKDGDCTAVRKYTKSKLLNSVEKYKWATQDCITHDGLAYIGRYSPFRDNLYVTTGFNKWGMTSAMASADILCDLLAGIKNEYADIYSPSRNFLGKKVAANLVASATGLLTPTAPRCPHMGCALKWNKSEKTWDCPCHGSRFTEDGFLLDNPSVKNMKRSR